VGRSCPPLSIRGRASLWVKARVLAGMRPTRNEGDVLMAELTVMESKIGEVAGLALAAKNARPRRSYSLRKTVISSLLACSRR
jgi:hypothetical protein